MSLLISELSQTLDRIVVIAPRKKQVQALFEKLTLELNSELAAGKKANLAIAAFKKGPLLTWCSFSLGQRAGLDVRVTMLGYSLEEQPPSSPVLELSDALLLCLPKSESMNERFLSLHFPSESRNRPCIIAGLLEVDNPEASEGTDLRTLALREWAKRNFEKVLHRPVDQENLLQQSVEWALSF